MKKNNSRDQNFKFQLNWSNHLDLNQDIPVQDLPRVPHRGLCDYQIEWHVEKFYLKFKPLCAITILIQATTEGVHISCESVQRAMPPDINTLCVKSLWLIFTGGVWICICSDHTHPYQWKVLVFFPPPPKCTQSYLFSANLPKLQWIIMYLYGEGSARSVMFDTMLLRGHYNLTKN